MASNFNYEIDENGIFICLACYGKFSSAQECEDHECNTHAKERPAVVEQSSPQRYDCKDCTKFFYSRTELLEHHERLHRFYRCTVCGGMFETTSKLDTHISVKHPTARLDAPISGGSWLDSFP